MNAGIPRLAGVAELAAASGLSAKRVSSLMKHRDAPAPLQDLAMGPVWVEATALEYINRDRPPGRPRKDRNRPPGPAGK